MATETLEALEGWQAIEHAQQTGATLNTYPTASQPPRNAITIATAKRIARTDPGAVWTYPRPPEPTQQEEPTMTTKPTETDTEPNAVKDLREFGAALQRAEHEVDKLAEQAPKMIRAARDAGLTATACADLLGIERAWMYRKFPAAFTKGE